VNIAPSINYSSNSVFFIVCLVFTHTNKMVLLNENIGILLKPVYPSSLMLIYP
jgi:hypothetical protein